MALLLGGFVFVAFNDRFTKGVRRKAVARLGAVLFASGIGLTAPVILDDNAATAAFIASMIALLIGAILIGYAHVKDR